MKIIKLILAILIGYFFGSIPWSLYIGKFIYKKDIREFGSGNLGGSNAIRTLGIIPGLIVIVLDSMKCFISMAVVNKIANEYIAFAGLACAIGHCWPFLADFRGGKAVACSYGYLLALAVYGDKDLIFTFLFPLLFLLMVLGLTKYICLASMSSMVFASIIGFLTYQNKVMAIITLLITFIIIYRHIDNIKRLLNKQEPKVNFII